MNAPLRATLAALRRVADSGAAIIGVPVHQELRESDLDRVAQACART